jgi:hypothetical protein
MKAMTVDDAAAAPCKPNDRANSVWSWGPKRAEPKHVTGKDQRLIECVIASLTRHPRLPLPAESLNARHEAGHDNSFG